MSDRARILVVDDEHNLCRILVARLSKDGFPADAVHDGAQALARLAQSAYDLMLLDLRMPVLGGAELLPEVRLRYPGTAVLVMTAYDSPEAVNAAMAAGADAYVTKPFDLDSIVDEARRILARRQRGLAGGGTLQPDGGTAACSIRLPSCLGAMPETA